MTKKNIFSAFILTFITILICCILYNFEMYSNEKKSVYDIPKLYPVLDERYRPSYAGEVENPRIELLSAADTGIIFELVDTSKHTKPYKDTFYCILTDDKMLRYYNGYTMLIVNGVSVKDIISMMNIEDKSIDKKELAKHIYQNMFEFQVLYRNYTIKLTDAEYNQVLAKIKNINTLFNPTDTEDFEFVTDVYDIKGLCLNSGYFDMQSRYYADDPEYPNIAKWSGKPKDKDKFKDKNEAELYYKEILDDFYSYIQSLIPNLEPYSFGKL